jgi:hypothetical protein
MTIQSSVYIKDTVTKLCGKFHEHTMKGGKVIEKMVISLYCTVLVTVSF